MIPPDKALPFDPDEFCVVADAATKIAKVLDPPSAEELRQSGCRDALAYNFALAVARRFKDDKETYDSFMRRWAAWLVIVASGELHRIFPTHDPRDVSRHALKVLATLTLETHGQPNKARFEAELRSRVALASN